MNKYLSGYNSNAKIVLRVSIVGIIANVILVAAKLVAGLIFDNLAVLSDAVHSASDLLTSLFVIAAVFLSSPKRDTRHNYGHEKIESLTVLFFAVLLAAIGGLFAWQGIAGLISPRAGEFNIYLIIVTVLSIAVKEALFWYGMHHAKKTKSEILKADAWHSRSDSLASIAVLIGLICSTFMSTNIVESIAVLVVSLFILKVAFDIFRPAVNILIDSAADKKDEQKIIELTQQVEGVKKIDEIKTRIYGSAIIADIEIHVNGKLTVEQGHDIAQAVCDKLENDSSLRIKHCNVHVNPCHCEHEE